MYFYPLIIEIDISLSGKPMKKLHLKDIKKILDQKVLEYNTTPFIARDPISVPHQFSKKQDIEIAAFFAATFAWGNRSTIINKANELMTLMDKSPHQFMLQHQESDLKRMVHFVHRTFNAHDLFYFIHFLSVHYRQSDSLESAFLPFGADTMKERLIHFQKYFFSMEHLHRTEKHVSTPAKNSACKRLNMFLRWMVRKDKAAVDFGIWSRISMQELICPLDVHVCEVAHRLGLLKGTKANWQEAENLTKILKELDVEDPVKYDFALFALGAEERFR